MPELPEVEHFRRLLLPLVASPTKSISPSLGLAVECPSPIPPKTFPDPNDLRTLKHYRVADVRRKGKLIRIDLVLIDCADTSIGGGGGDDDGSTTQKRGKRRTTPSLPPTRYLHLHMGMTGRISTPDRVLGLESLGNDDDYPPPHTHLILKSNGSEAAFSDPRRFGAATLSDPDLSTTGTDGEEAEKEEANVDRQFDDLAPDAMNELGDGPYGFFVAGLVGKRRGAKALLLDQRAVVSGVGNWVADEVLYQAEIHPNQTMLTIEEVGRTREKLVWILEVAVSCLTDGVGFPREWIFHRRWSKGRATRGGTAVKDSCGRKVEFVQSGGRTSAIVPSLQKLKIRKGGALHDKDDNSDDCPETSRRKGAKRRRKRDDKLGAEGKENSVELTKKIIRTTRKNRLEAVVSREMTPEEQNTTK